MNALRHSVLLLLLFLAGSSVIRAQDMNPQDDNAWREFRSARNYFSFRYPSNWHFYEETPGNYRFAEAVVSERGVFRIIEFFHSDDSFDVKRFLEDESKLKPGSSVRLINGYYMMSYTNLITYDGREMLQYVWVLGSGRVTLQCTYTIRNDMRTDEKIRLEYAQVFRAIENIRFLYQ